MTSEKHKVYRREYYKKNKEKWRGYYKRNRDEKLRKKAERYANDPEYRIRVNADTKKYHAEHPWLVHFRDAQQRCNNPNDISYKWYGGKGIRMLLTALEVELLYKRDHANKLKRPSIDRINPDGDYHFGNCRFMELSENCSRRRNGTV